MAKRVRGSRSSHRPGGQGPSRARRSSEGLSSASADPAAGSFDASPWDADIDDAIDSVILETTEITIDESQSVASQPRKARRGVKVRSDSLEARVAAENVYVREDLRRIGIVTAVLLSGLFLAWILFVALDLLALY